MEKSQYDLCVEILHRLDKAGLLRDIVLVGSWCTLFYKDFFGGQAYMTPLVTRDMDLLIPQPRKISAKADVAELLRDLGFVVGFSGSEGYIRLEHPQLIVEFLVPEKGRGSNKPYALPQLGLNAQALRFLEFLSQNTITAVVGSTTVTLPHPAYFALHKLLIMNRRPKAEKQTKDKEAAMRIINALIANKQTNTIVDAFCVIPKRWQNKIIKQLDKITEKHLIAILDGGQNAE